MLKRTMVTAGCLVGLGVATQILGAFPQLQVISDAHAQQRRDYKHTINMAGGQRTLSQRMSKELVLVALGYNARENLRNLRSSHEKFGRVLKGLRFGDSELALAASQDPAVLENLERVEEIWPLFESALKDSMAQGKVTRDSVSLVSDLSLPLLTAMDEAVKAYGDAATKGTLFSMVEIAIDQGGKLRMLSQKMSKEFLLVTYGEGADQNRERLKQSMTAFQRTLAGLMGGDPELQLIPAPTAQLQAQLKAVQRVWKETKPLLDLAVRGQKPNRDQLSDIASLNLTLLQESDAAVRMYQAF